MDTFRVEPLTDADKIEPCTAEQLFKFYRDVLNTFLNMVRDLVDQYPYKRSAHFFSHGSPRVRKKNAKRFSKWFKKYSKRG